jgi:hypothetical protein
MSQADVVNVLKKNNWLSSKQIAEKLNQGLGSTRANITKLLKQKNLEIKIVKTNNNIETLYSLVDL